MTKAVAARTVSNEKTSYHSDSCVEIDISQHFWFEFILESSNYVRTELRADEKYHLLEAKALCYISSDQYTGPQPGVLFYKQWALLYDLPSHLGQQNTLTASLQRGKTFSSTSVLYMTLNYLMVRLQKCLSFGKYGVPLHCHRSQVHSCPEVKKNYQGMLN